MAERSDDLRIAVAGVSGSGKSTIGRRLADRLDARYVEADDEHPPHNVRKMAEGRPLTDEDRWAWLATMRAELAGEPPVVVSCSALKRAYRDVLRGAGDVTFVLLDIDRDTALERVGGRSGHFMPDTLVDSQFADLERPVDEADVHVVDATRSIDDVTAAVVSAIGDASGPA